MGPKTKSDRSVTQRTTESLVAQDALGNARAVQRGGRVHWANDAGLELRQNFVPLLYTLAHDIQSTDTLAV